MPTVGKITQVIGSTFDAQFPEDALPRIYNALETTIKLRDGEQRLVGEVQQHLGGGIVRAVALGSTDGMVRGQEVTDTGAPVSVPVGEACLGRVFNVIQRCSKGKSKARADVCEIRQRQGAVGHALQFLAFAIFEAIDNAGVREADRKAAFFRHRFGIYNLLRGDDSWKNARNDSTEQQQS